MKPSFFKCTDDNPEYRGTLRHRQTLMARIRRGFITTAKMPLRCHPTLHMVPLFRQNQSTTPVSTHLPRALATTNLTHHHDLRMYMERRTKYPGFLRLCSDERYPPISGGQVP